MKLFIKLLLLLTVLGLAAPFVIKDDHGRPLLSLHDLQTHQGGFKQSILQTKAQFHAFMKKMRTATNPATQAPTAEPEDSSLTYVYTWQDTQGQWQFSDQAPAHTQAEILTLNPNENILPSTKQPSSARKVSSTLTTAPTETITQADTRVIPGLPTLEQAKKVFEDAKKVQGLSNQHIRELESY